MTRTALYARLSQDRSGESTSTDRQLADARAMAAARGWEVVAEYVDRDLSAYSSADRPGWEQLLADVEAGAIDVVVSWKLDRLLRRPRDFERLWSLAEPAGVNLLTVRDGIDTSAPMVGKLLPRFMAAFAELESESISVRARSKHAEIAKAGRHHGGGTRPFGLSADWKRIQPKEAVLVREAASRILNGESLRGVATDWNRRGIRTSTGGEWRAETLRQTLVSPRIAGLRRHHGAVVGSGGYPAIVDEPTFRALEAALSQRNGSRGPQARAYLLSGFLRCSRCGRAMTGHRDENGTVRYLCMPKPRGCGGMTIKGEPADELIREAILHRLDGPELAAALREREQDSRAAAESEQLRGDEAALEQLARDHYVDRMISRAEFLAARDALEHRIAAARKRQAKRNGSGLLAGLAGAQQLARARWEAGDLEWRRSVIAPLVERIDVAPALRGRNRFDPNRLSPVWRT
jgi:site-specific DNA recombinase